MRTVCRLALGFNLSVSLGLFAASAFFACGPQLFSYALLALLSTVMAAYRVAGSDLARLRFRFLRRAVRLRRAGGLLLAAGARKLAASGPALRPFALPVAVLFVLFLLGEPRLLAESPWVQAANAVCEAFVGPIGKGLALVAFVVGGLMFAFGEGGSKSALAGLIFGAGMVLSAPAFLEWILGENTVCG